MEHLVNSIRETAPEDPDPQTSDISKYTEVITSTTNNPLSVESVIKMAYLYLNFRTMNVVTTCVHSTVHTVNRRRAGGDIKYRNTAESNPMEVNIMLSCLYWNVIAKGKDSITDAGIQLALQHTRVPLLVSKKGKALNEMIGFISTLSLVDRGLTILLVSNSMKYSLDDQIAERQ